jgi:hypothetical protein
MVTYVVARVGGIVIRISTTIFCTQVQTDQRFDCNLSSIATSLGYIRNEHAL